MPSPLLPPPDGAAPASALDGFRSLTVLLPGDDPADFLNLLDELTAHFDPQDLTDRRYVREMADAEWRLRRVRLFQERYLAAQCHELQPQIPQADPIEIQCRAYAALLHESTLFPRLAQFEARYRQQYDRAHRGWLTYQRHRQSAAAREARQHKDAHITAVLEFVDRPTPAPREEPAHSPAEPVLTNEPNSPAPDHARNAPCPCGSGLKYKRCCGRQASPLLTPSPRQAA